MVFFMPFILLIDKKRKNLCKSFDTKFLTKLEFLSTLTSRNGLITGKIDLQSFYPLGIYPAVQSAYK